MPEIITYGRNNSTGNPTQTHILDDNGKVLCGWKGDFCAEVGLESTDSFEYCELNYCKKCLKSFKKLNQ